MPENTAPEPPSIQEVFLAYLARRFAVVDFEKCFELYGSMDGIFATMLQPFPDRIINDPRIGPCFTAARLAKVRGVTRQAISKQDRAGRIFGITHAGARLYPSIQFDHNARTRPAFTALFASAQEANQDPLDFAIWLHTPNDEYGLSPARWIEQLPDTRSATEQQLDGFVPEIIVVTGKHSPRTTTRRRDA